MSKVTCQSCGFVNPANILTCVKCNSPLPTKLKQALLGNIWGIFKKEKEKKTVEEPERKILKVKSLTGQKIRTDSGQVLEIGTLLGQGGYCDVYVARDDETHEKVAIKLLRFWEIQARGREEVETRFWFEYRMGLIDSPYLVKALSRGEVSGNPFYVMELCEGGALADRIQRHYTDTQLRKLAVDILKGLQVLHKQGMTHRDLKPQNIIFKDSRPRLIDFGVSGRKNVKLTQHGQVLGTDVYLAPEWFNQELKDQLTRMPTIDIYSFGILMFEVISRGKYPYGEKPDPHAKPDIYEKTLNAYYQNVRNNAWVTLNELFLSGGISDFWAVLIQHCIYNNAKERYQDVAQIIELLGNPNPSNYCPTCDLPIQNKRSTHCSECNSYLLNGTLSLRISIGEDEGKSFNLTLLNIEKPIITLGRKVDEGLGNDILIKDYETMLTVSRYHATIEKSEKTGLWFIRDGQWRPNEDGEYVWSLSKNGIFVNNVKAGYMGVPFFPNDIITIGNIIFEVDFTPD